MTFNYRRGEWTKIRMTWNNARRALSLRLAQDAKMLPSLRRGIEIELATEKAARRVAFSERPIAVPL